MSASRAKRISTHSFRITLGCKLKAAGCSDSTILALCRWQSLKSLEVYCRLTPKDYAATLGRARRADAKSIQVTSLPDLGDEQDEGRQRREEVLGDRCTIQIEEYGLRQTAIDDARRADGEG
jgi:hypothetical protein